MKALYHPLHSGNQRRYGFILFWLLVLMLLSLAGCGNSSSHGPTPSGTATIGAEGGTVSSPEGAEIVVPEGAFESDATIRIAMDSTGAPAVPQDLGATGNTYMITPHGGEFTQPVEVHIPVPDIVLEPNQVLKLAKAQPGGSWEILNDSTLIDGKLVAQVNSFSFFTSVIVVYPISLEILPPFEFGPIQLQCDGAPCASVELMRPMKMTVSVSNNGGQLPSGCLNPRFRITDRWQSPKHSWITPANITPGQTTQVEFDFHGNSTAILRNQRFEASGEMVCGSSATGFSYTSAGYADFAVIYGNTSPTTPYVVQFPATLTQGVGDTPTLSPVLVQGGAYLTSYPQNEPGYHYENWDGRYQAPTVWDHATVHLERLGPTDTVWTVVATKDQLDANPYALGTGSPEWLYWSLDYPLGPLTLADNGAMYQVRGCFKGSGDAVEQCQVGPTMRLTVLQQLQPPAYTQQPRSMLINPGETASFNAVVTGTPTATLQWQTRPADGISDWVNVTNGSGATSVNYTTPVLGLTDDGVQYRVLATNSAASTASQAVSVLVSADAEAPSIVSQPGNLTVITGSEALFAVATRGTEAISYQWRKDGQPLAGANGLQLKLTSVSAGNAGNYSVVVSNTAGTVVSNDALLSVNPSSGLTIDPPGIVTQPAAVAVTEGNVATFAVGVSGTGPFGFQWRKNGVDIAGATSAAYTLQAVALADAGNYSVNVVNSAGSVLSQVATLAVAATVTQAVTSPTIVTQPGTVVVSPGMGATLAVGVQGSGPISYQWLHDSAEIPGQTLAIYTIDAASAQDAGTYEVQVSNSAGTVVSSPAQVLLLGAPAIAVQPVDTSVAAGSTATFSVTSSGNSPFYQWMLNGVAISGATSASYTTPVLSVADNGAVYGVVVYNGAGVVISNNAVLTCQAVSAWQGATLIEIGTGNLPIVPRMAMNPNGDAFATWVQNGSGSYPDVWSDRYVADTGWESATMMEASDTNVGEPSIAIEASGNAMAVWPQTDGLRTSIWASRYVVGSGWATPALIETDNAGDAYSPNIAFDPSGNAIAVWHQSDGTRLNVWSNRYVAGTGWGTAALIENNDLGGASHPKVATDANGNAIAVWSQYDGTTRIDVWTNRYVVGTGWGTPELLDTENLGSVGFPTIAMDASGNAFAVWGQWDGSRNNVWSNRYVVGTGWGTAALLETDDAGDATPGPVVMDVNGNAMVAWSQSDGTNLNAWARRYDASTGWGTAALLETDNSGDVGIPSIAMNASGAAVAVWHQSDGTLNSIWASHYAAASGWGTPLLLETNDATDAIYPGVVMSASGSAIASWVQGNGAGDNNLWANVFK